MRHFDRLTDHSALMPLASMNRVQFLISLSKLPMTASSERGTRERNDAMSERYIFLSVEPVAR